MKKKIFLCVAFATVGNLVANADDAKTYVSIQQNGNKVDAVGTAVFDVSKNPTFEFDDDGNAVVIVNGNTVAKLPMANGGEMAMEFEGTDDNTFTSTVGMAGYGTLYSPFQLTVPSNSNVEVYAPTYENGTIKMNQSTMVPSWTIIPVGTGLILKNQGDITFIFSDEVSTLDHDCVLSGSALTIPTPTYDDKYLFTLGHAEEDGELGFWRYSGANIAAGKAYLLLDKTSKAKFVPFSFDDDITGVASYEIESHNEFVSPAYNLAGQRVNSHAKGIVIVDGKKVIK